MFIGMTLVTYFSLAFILHYAIERHFYTQDFNYISSRFNAIDKDLEKSPESIFQTVPHSTCGCLKAKTLSIKTQA